MRFQRTTLAAILAASLAAAPVAEAQQYFTGMRAGDCARMGGRINVYTGPVGSDIGECYVPPRMGGGGGGGGSYSPGYAGGGGNDAAAIALGVAAGIMLLELLVNIADQWGRESGPPSGISGSPNTRGLAQPLTFPAKSYLDSPQFIDELTKAKERNAQRDTATSDVQDFVRRRGQRNALSGTRCNGYPATREGVTQCHLAAATALEGRAGACRDEACKSANLHGAAAARCTVGFDPAPDNMDVFSRQCARSPGEYARFKKRLDEYFPWADDVKSARQIRRTREEVRGSLYANPKERRDALRREPLGRDVEVEIQWRDAQGNVLHRYDTKVDSRCLDDAASATICDLAWKARASKIRGWRPDTPFNCGRARGNWEGDIVNGYCRYPGSDRPAWTPQPYVAEDLKVLGTTVDNALRLDQEGHVQGAYRQALYAEQVLGTIMMLSTTMSPPEREAALDSGLAQIDRLVRALR
ncbi:MAG: hypothetical protein KIT25_05200 [Enhydrobacter sp.]|nr:MAG: hypothetical protein KIT25_05200 [Enhydrobacter sp.]